MASNATSGATAVYFDCRYIRVDHHDGISRFSAGLFSAMTAAGELDLTAIINDERQLSHLPAGTKWVMLNDPTHWSEAFAARKLNRLGAKLVYSPMQTIGSLGRKFKLVLTLHDLIYYRHPAPPPSMPLAVRIGWRLFHLTYWPQRWMLNGADSVVTVSQTTANLIAKHHLTKRPVTLVYNAADEGIHASVRTRPAIESESAGDAGEQNLVYMGSFMDYKNVQTLAAGMQQLPGYKLHLLSKISPANRAKIEAAAGSAANQVVFHNGVTDAAYHAAIASAVALVHASQDEGFGIPLVEAMSLGTPIAVSDIEIFHEIGGDAAEYFAATDANAFVAAIRRLEDPTMWAARSAAGLIQVEKFSWSESAAVLTRLLTAL